MSMTTQHFGRKLSEQGYLNDSMGLGIDPGAIYNVTWKEDQVVSIYRLGVTSKKPKVEIRKRTANGPTQ